MPVSEQRIAATRGSLVIDYAWAEPGEETALVFQDKSLKLKPGDLIVKD